MIVHTLIRKRCLCELTCLIQVASVNLLECCVPGGSSRAHRVTAVSLSMLSGTNWVTVSSLRVFGEIDTESSEAIACDMEELS